MFHLEGIISTMGNMILDAFILLLYLLYQLRQILRQGASEAALPSGLMLF